MLKLCSSVLWGGAGAAPVGGGSSGTTGWVSEPHHGPGLACRGGDPRGLGPWRVPGVRAPSSACCSMEIKHRPRSHACLRRRKRRLAAGWGEAAGLHVPVEECGGAGPGRGGERRRSAMGRPLLLAAAAALLLLLPPSTGTGAAVTRLRVSANFVSAGEGRWRGKMGGGRRRAYPRLFACRSAGPPVSSGGAGLSARGCSCPAVPAPGCGGIVGLPPPAATGSWRTGWGGSPGFRGTELPASEDSRSPRLPGPRGSPLPKTPDRRGSPFPRTPGPQGFPLPRTPNHRGSRFARTLNPRGTSLPSTPPFRVHLPGTPRGSPPSKHSQSPGLLLPAGPPAHGRPPSALPLQPTGH